MNYSVLALDMFDDFKEDVECNSFTGFSYADTWDYEEDYSHNEIDVAREQFIKLVNNYFNKKHMNYTMREVVENAWVCDLNGDIIR